MNIVSLIIEPIIAAVLIISFLMILSKSCKDGCNKISAALNPEPPPFEPTTTPKPKRKRIRKPAAKNLGDIAIKTQVRTAPKIKGKVKTKTPTN